MDSATKINRRAALKAAFVALPAAVVPGIRLGRNRADRCARHTADMVETENELHQARDLVERFTGRSTWDGPFGDFEHAVVADALTRQTICFEWDGSLVASDADCEHYAYFSLSDIVADSLELLDRATHPDDRADALLAARDIAAKLRAAATEFEAWTIRRG